MTATLAQQTASFDLCQDAQALKVVFESLDEYSCPKSYNFHLHTCFSDGQLQPEVLAEQAITHGLRGFAVTDHHSVQGFNRVHQHFQHLRTTTDSSLALPQLWIGVEITSILLNTEVHILGYAFDPEHPALAPYLTGERPNLEAGQVKNVIAALHAAGGWAVLAHPERYRHPAADVVAAAVADGIDGVETFYAYNNPSPWQTSPKQTQTVQSLAIAYNLFSTCGTDTHGLNILQRL